MPGLLRVFSYDTAPDADGEAKDSSGQEARCANPHCWLFQLLFASWRVVKGIYRNESSEQEQLVLA